MKETGPKLGSDGSARSLRPGSGSPLSPAGGARTLGPGPATRSRPRAKPARGGGEFTFIREFLRITAERRRNNIRHKVERIASHLKKRLEQNQIRMKQPFLGIYIY